MHMADMLVSPAVGAAMYAASLSAAAAACRKINLEKDESKIPLMGVVGAFIFAAQMINFSIPGTGSSGHLSGGLLAAALLGPYEGFLVIMAVLAVQCLLFADGGLLALGCNIWNMGFYACFFSWFCIFRPITGKNFTKKRICAASLLGGIVSLQLGAASVTLETLLSGVTPIPFWAFFSLMQPIHLAIGIVEGLVTAAILCYILETKPEILNGGKSARGARPAILTFFLSSLMISGGLSLLASQNPDGLEWSLEKLGVGNEGADGSVFAALQDAAALFPDYGIAGSQSFFSGSIAGISGVLFMTAAIIFTALLYRYLRKKANSDHELSA